MPENTNDKWEGPSVKMVTQFFHPDTSANATILTELAIGLADRGVDIDVLTGQPAYSSADRERTEPKFEVYEGVPIRRIIATRFDKNEGTKYRLLNDVSFFLSAFLHLLFSRRKQTLLLPTAPPFLPILGWWLGTIRGYSYVPVVYDLYPDMAVELGYLSEDGVVYRVWDWLNRCAYRRADEVITIGETMKETLVSKYGEECNVTVIHNWEDGEFIQPQQKTENEFSWEHNLVEPTTVLYSGNLGLHHDLESVVEAASKLEKTRRSVSDQFEFLFIGEGGKKPKLMEMAADYGLDTVSFLPYQPKEVLPDSLTSGDIALVTMEEGVEGLCVSSKFYTALASGQAVLAISKPDSEIGRVVERTGCGIRVDPQSPDQIVDAITRWLDDPEMTEKMGERAREVFEQEFNKQRSLKQYHEQLSKVDG
ncbi:glycosyltransferase family 4 protein [Halorussus limi]|uniref:Glycosyltransferase family 4 protein n=1 Tax=Halorussus limi TaxID=2938695 RepID=A0A8U0HXF1_9EURY|nr:glycosyltransferase family 4 protein [Halorussus limi]UPV75244.1 glycosyltransferase family 4 protein [Halorussus limi]